MQAWLPIMLSAAMLAVSLLTLYRARRRDSEEDIRCRASLAADVSYIRLSVDDIRAESRIIRRDMQAMDTRVTRVEASAASAHKRLDERIGKGECSHEN